MPSADLPLATREFISRHIRSVEQMEILLLLWGQAEVVWTVESVYAAILSTPASVERWLDELTRQGFLTRLLTTPATYRYEAREALPEQVTALAQCYKTAPVRVIEAVYKPRPDAAQSFADAFKLTPPDKP